MRRTVRFLKWEVFAANQLSSCPMSEQTIKVEASPAIERAPNAPLNLPSGIRRPQYGRYLEEFVDGEVFVHPRGITVNASFIHDFSATFLEANPLYLNEAYARAHGFRSITASPLMVLNIALSLGVQNDSEKAIAHLGYYNVKFLRPVYPGDTLRSLTKVISRKERGDEPGIVHVRTIGVNQHEQLVVQYDRKIMIPKSGDKRTPALRTGPVEFPEQNEPVIEIPLIKNNYPTHLTGSKTYFEDFTEGEVVIHANGRTITDEHYAWTYRLGNTHPLHFDRLYTTSLSGPLRGEPVVYGGLVFAWLTGLASRDTTENALWDFGYHEGYHTQPVVAGDTVYAISRVLAKEDGPSELRAGVVHLHLIGVKNIRGEEAIEKFGADLFIKENDKKKMGKEKIPQKIFEIERSVLIKRRPLA